MRRTRASAGALARTASAPSGEALGERAAAAEGVVALSAEGKRAKDGWGKDAVAGVAERENAAVAGGATGVVKRVMVLDEMSEEPPVAERTVVKLARRKGLPLQSEGMLRRVLSAPAAGSGADGAEAAPASATTPARPAPSLYSQMRDAGKRAPRGTAPPRGRRAPSPAPVADTRTGRHVSSPQRVESGAVSPSTSKTPPSERAPATNVANTPVPDSPVTPVRLFAGPEFRADKAAAVTSPVTPREVPTPGMEKTPTPSAAEKSPKPSASERKDARAAKTPVSSRVGVYEPASVYATPRAPAPAKLCGTSVTEAAANVPQPCTSAFAADVATSSKANSPVASCGRSPASVTGGVDGTDTSTPGASRNGPLSTVEPIAGDCSSSKIAPMPSVEASGRREAPPSKGAVRSKARTEEASASRAARHAPGAPATVKMPPTTKKLENVSEEAKVDRVQPKDAAAARKADAHLTPLCASCSSQFPVSATPSSQTSALPATVSKFETVSPTDMAQKERPLRPRASQKALSRADDVDGLATGILEERPPGDSVSLNSFSAPEHAHNAQEKGVMLFGVLTKVDGASADQGVAATAARAPTAPQSNKEHSSAHSAARNKKDRTRKVGKTTVMPPKVGDAVSTNVDRVPADGGEDRKAAHASTTLQSDNLPSRVPSASRNKQKLVSEAKLVHTPAAVPKGAGVVSTVGDGAPVERVEASKAHRASTTAQSNEDQPVAQKKKEPTARIERVSAKAPKDGAVDPPASSKARAKWTTPVTLSALQEPGSSKDPPVKEAVQPRHVNLQRTEQFPARAVAPVRRLAPIVAPAASSAVPASFGSGSRPDPGAPSQSNNGSSRTPSAGSWASARTTVTPAPRLLGVVDATPAPTQSVLTPSPSALSPVSTLSSRRSETAGASEPGGAKASSIATLDTSSSTHLSANITHGAARVMDPNFFKPVGSQWRGRVDTIGRDTSDGSSVTTDAAKSKSSSGGEAASSPVSSSSSVTGSAEDPDAEDYVSEKYQGLRVRDEELAVLATRLRNPKFGVRLVPVRTGLFRRSRQCFSAAEVTAWIAGYKRCDRDAAVLVVQRLVTANVIRSPDADKSAQGRKEVVRDSAKDMYVFVDHAENCASTLAVTPRGLAKASSGTADAGTSPASSAASTADVARDIGFEDVDTPPARPARAGSRRTRADSAAEGSANGNVHSRSAPTNPINGVVLNDVHTDLAEEKPVGPVALTVALLQHLQAVCAKYSGSGTSSGDCGVPEDAAACPQPHWLKDADDSTNDRISEYLARHGRSPVMSDVKADFVLPQANEAVNVARLVSSPEFARFERATTGLQSVDLTTLTTRDGKAAFALNLYNLLSLHARLSFGTRVNRGDRARVGTRVLYRVGGHLFCLDDILNITLRGETRPAKGLSKMLARPGRSSAATEWPRRLAVQPTMPEALLAVRTTGTSFDAPIRAYTEEGVCEELNAVGDRFLSTWVRIRASPTGGSVARVPRVFSTFGADFAAYRAEHAAGGGGDADASRGVLEWIADHMTSNAELSGRVRGCDAVDFYKTADALEARDGKGDAVAPAFWSAAAASR